MSTLISCIVLVFACAVVVHIYRRARGQRMAAQRLAAGLPQRAEPGTAAARPIPTPHFARRHYIAPWLAAAVAVAGSHYLLRLPWSYSIAIGAMTGLLLGQLDAILLARAHRKIETQLADSIDLMVSSLKVGASLQAALESALRESHAPLRDQLDEVVGRIRLGDDPRSAFGGLGRRVPLESFHLLVTTLTAHWDVGGSLTGALATLGRTIRDRLEIDQRLYSLTTQARASVVAIMLTTYFIAALMWRSSPARMSHFLAADVGQWMAGVSIVLQGIGIVWVSKLRNVRY